MITGFGIGGIYGFGLNPRMTLLLVSRCIPCINIVGVYPNFNLTNSIPNQDLINTIGTIGIENYLNSIITLSLIGSLDINKITPEYLLEECDCE